MKAGFRMFSNPGSNTSLPPSPDAGLPPLVAIVGPTASGKSALAVWLAQRFNGEVLACDSTQVYCGFDIGTSKPGLEERGGVPHHMMDLVGPEELFSAGDYRRRALTVLAGLRQRARLPILSVGTGLYLRALLEGLADAPPRSDSLRARLQAIARRRDNAHLHAILRRLDPAAAARISRNDQQKLIRALEICLLAGRPLTEVHRAGREPLPGYAPLKIGLCPPRPELYRRIEWRARRMLERGWVGEVKALLDRGTPASAKPFEFIGYRELRAHLAEGKPLEEALSGIVLSTRHYAKRQLTWFRKEPGVHWLEGFGDRPEIMAAATAFLERELPRLLPARAARPQPGDGPATERV